MVEWNLEGGTASPELKEIEMSNLDLDQLAAELGLSGMALTMVRCEVASALSWKAGEVGPGFVGTEQQRSETAKAMMDGWRDSLRFGAEQALAISRAGRDYPRSLTAARLAAALIGLVEQR